MIPQETKSGSSAAPSKGLFLIPKIVHCWFILIQTFYCRGTVADKSRQTSNFTQVIFKTGVFSFVPQNNVCLHEN